VFFEGLSFYNVKLELERLPFNNQTNSPHICDIDTLTEGLQTVRSNAILNEVAVGKKDIKGNDWDESLIKRIREVANKRLEIAKMRMNALFYDKIGNRFMILGYLVAWSSLIIPRHISLALKVGSIFLSLACIIKFYHRTDVEEIRKVDGFMRKQCEKVCDELQSKISNEC